MSEVKDVIKDNINIGRSIRTFVEHIDSLSITLPSTLLAINQARKVALERFREFEKDHIAEEEKDGKIIRKVDSDQYYQFRKLFGRFKRGDLAKKAIPRSYVVSLISQYDAFVGELIKSILIARPEILNISDRQITFSQLQDFGSIESARDYILEKEIEMLLRKSHIEQFEWMENKFEIKLRKNLEIWPKFVETTQRRNLFVHTNGFVSSQYINICKNNGGLIDESIKVGDELEATQTYFDDAYQCVLEIGIKLAQVLWRKMLPEEIENADGILINTSVDLLCENKYNVARNLLDFSVETLKKYSSEKNRRMMVVNRAQAYKWLGDKDRSLEILGSEDWSATSTDFQLAESVLTDNYDKAADLMRQIGTSGSIPKANYATWPLFKEFRISEQFKQAYKDIFSEEFSAAKFDPDEVKE